MCTLAVMFLPDRKNCENVHGKPLDLAYNAASFVWCPEMGAKVRVVVTMCILWCQSSVDLQECQVVFPRTSPLLRLCFVSTALAQSSPPRKEWKAFLFTLSQTLMKMLTLSLLNQCTGPTAKSRFLETRYSLQSCYCDLHHRWCHRGMPIRKPRL